MKQMGRDSRKQAYAEAAAQGNGPQEENLVRVNGFAQVVEMLQVADPEFRESLLRRLAARDQRLAKSLRADLGRN